MNPNRLVILASISLGVSSLPAADGTWNGTAGNWSNTGIWSGSGIADGTNSTAFFTAELTANQTVTVDANRTIGNITFTDGTTASHNLTLAAGGILTLDTSSGSPDISVTQASRLLTISATVAGTDGFTKSGPGRLFLNATGGNTFSGALNLAAGSLQMNGDGNIGDSNNDINVTGTFTLFSNSGSTVNLNASRAITLSSNLTFEGQGGQNRGWQVSGPISGNGNLSLAGATTNLTLAGGNTFTGSIAIGTGGQTASASNHTLLTVGTGVADSTSTLGDTFNAVSLGGFNQANEGVASQNGSAVLRFSRNDYTFSGNITGAGIVEINPGDSDLSAGAVITLAGNNTHTGQVIIRQGGLLIEDADALSANANLRFNQAGVLLIGTDLDTSNAADFTRAVGTGAGQVQWTNGGGFAAVGTNRTIDVGGAGGAFFWSSIGTSNALFLGHQDADATVEFTNDLVLTGTGNRNLRVFNGAAAVDGEISGDISGSGVGIVKNETGSLLLSGNSTYDGTTVVNAGALIVTGSLGSTAVTVGSTTAATLGGNGTIDGPVSVSASGTLAPGLSPGILTLNGDLTLGGSLAMEVSGLAVGTGYDQVLLGGDGTLGGNLVLTWSLGTLAPLATELILINSTGPNAFSGAFANAADLSTVTDNLGGLWEVRYSGGTGNDLSLVAIPEPATAWLCLAIGGGLLAKRRRREPSN